MTNLKEREIVMKNTNGTVTEIICTYAERPHAILKMKRLGFSLDDITITRLDARTYSVLGKKQA